MLFDLVESAYVINLPHRHDRRRAVEAELARINHANDKRITFFDAFLPNEKGDFPSIGARGCFFSHLGVLRDAAEKGLQSVAIFEDDLRFAEDFRERVPHVADALKHQRWDIFYGGWFDPSAEFDPGHGLIAPVPAMQEFQRAHFICFNDKTIAALVEYLDGLLSRPPSHPDGGPMHVDGAYNRYRQAFPETVTFAVSEELGLQRSSRSDIAALRWFDRSPFISNAVNMLRRFR